MANCTCTQTRELGAKPNIICDGPVDNGEVFKTLFYLLSMFTDEKSRDLGRFVLATDAVVEITDNFFHNITFTHVFLGTAEKISQVPRIHPKAFEGPIGGVLEELTIRSDKLGHNKDVFKSLRPLKNMRKVWIEGREMTHIPRLAFCPDIRKKESYFPKLEEIRFRVTPMSGLIYARSIGPRAFWNLPSLRLISAESHDIQKVGVRAFGLPVPVETPLEIDLSFQWNQNFTETSFLPATFADLNRPVFLNLYGNPKISFLLEDSFRKFLDQNPNNKIKLGQKMNCGCPMLWLFRDKAKYEKQFVGWSFDDPDVPERFIHCEQNDELWGMKLGDFNHCDRVDPNWETIKEENEKVKDEL